jgi:hypothetical protein
LLIVVCVRYRCWFNPAPPPVFRARLCRKAQEFSTLDCLQVVIALVVPPDGFPLAYEAMHGNTSERNARRTQEGLLLEIRCAQGAPELPIGTGGGRGCEGKTDVRLARWGVAARRIKGATVGSRRR